MLIASGLTAVFGSNYNTRCIVPLPIIPSSFSSKFHANELEHQGGSVHLERTASSRFYLKWLRAHCRVVSGACNGCKVLFPIMIDDGLMRHLSSSTRETFCRKFNLRMGNNLLPTEDSPTINLTTHEPISLECTRPNSRCFLDCIHFWLTGKPHKSTRLQAGLTKQQR